MNRWVRKTRREKVAIKETNARDETAINPFRCNRGKGSITVSEGGNDTRLSSDGSFPGWSCGLKSEALWAIDMMTLGPGLGPEPFGLCERTESWKLLAKYNDHRPA